MIPRTDRSAATSTTPASSKVLRCRYRLAWGISGTSTASCLVVNTPRARAPIRRMRCGCRITSLLLVPIIGNAITSENRQLAGTVLFSAYQADPVVSEPPTRPARRPASRRQGQFRERAIRQVAILEITGRLTDVIEDLDQAIQVALAEGPRGVVCD